MKKKFTVILVKEGDGYVARCQEMPDAVARGSSKGDALEKLRAVIIKKIGEDGSDAGSAPVPQPVRPPPHGPIIELHEKPDV